MKCTLLHLLIGFLAFVTFCVWLELTDRYVFEMAWQQGTLLYHPGVRPVEMKPR